MADEVFNIAKGRIVEFYNRVKTPDPANAAFVVVLLKVAEADALLRDYDTLALLLAGSNTEANFTNYARKVISAGALASLPAPDDTNDRREVDIADQTWTAAGGTLNNTLVKAIICYDPDSTGGTDTTLVPLCHYDFPRTTNGTDLIMQIHPNGFFRAT